MKKILRICISIILFVTIANSNIYGQKNSEVLNGYKYVFIDNLIYGNGNKDIWGICSELRNIFSDKGLVTFYEVNSPPKEVYTNPCLVLSCYVNHTNVSTFGKNEISITLKNCKNQIVYSTSAKGIGQTMQDDFNKALSKISSKVNELNYHFNPELTPEMDFPKVELTNETENSLKKYFDTNKLDGVEGIYKSYESEGLGYYKIAIKKKDYNYVAIILEADIKSWKPGEIKAYFEKSSVEGVYSVKWYKGDKTSYNTFGTIENGVILSIEFKNEIDKTKELEKFIKMYPSITKGVVVKSDNSKASGSGFFISPNGIIATNAHVIEDANKIELIITNQLETFTYNAKVLLKDIKNDVALLQIDDVKFKALSALPYTLIEKTDVGEQVYTIGYPLNDIMGGNYKVTDGIISSNSGIADDVRYFQISVPIQPGNSGGPLFNKDGNIIGITSAKLNSKAVGTQIENVNYAIKISYLLNLYNMLPNSVELLKSSQLVGKEMKEQIKTLKNYVCLIKVY